MGSVVVPHELSWSLARGIFPETRDWTCIPCIGRRILIHCTTRAEKAMATHSSVLAWKLPWMEEPGGLPSVGLHRVGHDWSDLAAAAAPPGKSYSRCFCQGVLSFLTPKSCQSPQPHKGRWNGQVWGVVEIHLISARCSPSRGVTTPQRN